MTDFVFNVERRAFNAGVFVAPTATVIGDVTLGPETSIWYGASLRADFAPIRIGARSNVQDNASIHVDYDQPAVIGDNVTIGHNAVVHGAVVEDDCLIGMGAIVLNGAVIGKGSLVAAGAVVKEGMVVPPGSLVAGVPAKILRTVTPEQQESFRKNAADYVACAKAHQGAMNT
jgi:carbonic anhydrase/acetyltransferase-like protein (isoleucine patch superfamily)